MKIDHNQLKNIIDFIAVLDKLKDTTRTAWTTGGRQESTAEHSWRLCMFAFSLKAYFPNADISKVIQICLVHDLGEIFDGDVSAALQVDSLEKHINEEKAVKKLVENLPNNLKQDILSLVKEYNDGQTQEAKIAKALDKMETIIQHNQGDNPNDFDYAFNLNYGYQLCQDETVLKELRNIVDQQTADNIH